MGGTGEKLVTALSACQLEILKKIPKMSDNEVEAALAFIETLERINNRFSEK